MDIQIRETNDAALLAALNEQVQQLHHALYPDVFKPFDHRAITGFFDALFTEREAKAFLAMSGEEVLGYVLVLVNDQPENPFQHARSYAVLDQIHVLEDYRGNGVGKLLFEQVVAWTREQMLDRIELNHWTQNHIARGFFNACGFRYCRESMFLQL